MDIELLFLLAGIGIIPILVGSILILVVRDTARRSGVWGINFEIPNCPQCRAKMPTVRKPKSVRQAVFGGWDCPSCNCKMDKWGNAV